MLINKITTIIALALSFGTAAMAGTEDWNGSFTIQDPNGQTKTIKHTPSYINFYFFTAGTCLFLGKGITINGLKINQDTNLCVSSSVEQFTVEVQKIGSLIRKDVKLGPTYQ